MHDSDSKEIIEYLPHWADQQSLVRAMILTSSRAIPNSSSDILSDYDVILIVHDILPFFESRNWLEAFGSVLALYRDPLEFDLGYSTTAYVVQYESGLKIDFTINVGMAD